MDDWENWDLIEHIDGVNYESGNVELYIAITNDDPFFSSGNVITRPSELDHVSWITSNASVVANAAVAPDNTMTADKLVANTSNTTHSIRYDATISLNQLNLFSVFVKAAGYNFARVRLYKTSDSTHNANIYVSLIDGSISAIDYNGDATSGTATTIYRGNGWWEVQFVLDVANSGNDMTVAVYPTISLVGGNFAGDDTAGIYVWGAQLIVGSTPYEANWSDYQRLFVSDYTGRAFKYKAVITSTTGERSPAVVNLAVDVDMPDFLQSAEDLTAPVDGYLVVFPYEFRSPRPAITPVVQGLQQGDYWEITNQSSQGFNIEFFDSVGNSVSRVFDYIARGYGFVVT